MPSYSTEAEFPISHPPAAVWPFISDTNAYNRVTFSAPVVGVPGKDADGNSVLKAETRLGPLRLTYDEYPFEWRSGEGFSVRRVLLGGPVASITMTLAIRPNDAGSGGEGRQGSIVRARLDAEIRYALLMPLVRLIGGPATLRGYRLFFGRVQRALDAQAAAGRRLPGPEVLSVFPAPVTGLDRGQLDGHVLALQAKGFSPALTGRLRQHLSEAPDEDVRGMRPFALADRWGEPRKEVLRLFLHATPIGLLDLSWEVLCPNCRVAKADYGTLRKLQTTSHCESCEIDFAVDFERLVELRFHVNARVRPAEDHVYCLGSPRWSPHVVAQAALQPGGSREEKVPAGVSVLRVRAQGIKGGTRIFREVGAPEAARVAIGTEGSAVVTLAPEGGVVTVENTGERPVTMILEEEEWPSDIASAAFVTTMSEFREMFSSEVLAPNVQISLQNVAVLFSDLKGSTRFYRDIGDALAFSVVRDHFAILSTIVDRHDGTFVKTIGDAIMAVFQTAPQAVAAALEMQATMRAWKDPRVPNPATFVKLGIHEGPAIVVTLNDRLDYFGTTVNMAARVQAQSVGGDLVLSEAMVGDGRVAALLEGHRVEPFQAILAGFDAPSALFRVSPVDG